MMKRRQIEPLRHRVRRVVLNTRGRRGSGFAGNHAPARTGPSGSLHRCGRPCPVVPMTLVVLIGMTAAIVREALADDGHGTERWSTFHGGPHQRGFVPGDSDGALEERWTYLGERGVKFAPIEGKNRIVVVNDDSHLIGLSLAGEKIWEEIIPSPDSREEPSAEVIAAPPVAAGGWLLVTTRQGSVVCLDSETGALRWRQKSKGPFLGSPTWRGMTGGRIRFFTISQADGVVRCYDPLPGLLLWSSKPEVRCDGHLSADLGRLVFGNCNAVLTVLNAEDGKRLHQIELGQGSEIAGGVPVQGTIAFSGSRGGMLVAADVSKGSLLWSNQCSEAEIFTTPAVGSEQVVVIDEEGAVHAIGKNDGERHWEYRSGAMDISSVVMAGERLFFSADGALVILNATNGERMETKRISDRLTPPAIIDGSIVIGVDDGRVIAFDLGGHRPDVREGP